MDRTCINCNYYKGKLCYRFPKVVEKTPDDFCGEFTLINEKVLYDSEYIPNKQVQNILTDSEYYNEGSTNGRKLVD